MYNIRVASDPWKPWKTPGKVNTPEKVPEIRWKLEWSLKKYEKSRQKLAISLKWLFRWPYLQFWFLNFHLWQAIIIIVYCCTHLFFSIFPFVFIQVNSHCPRASRALKPSIDTEIVQEDARINSWTVGL